MLKLFFYLKSNKFVQATRHPNPSPARAKYVRPSSPAQGAQRRPRRGTTRARAVIHQWLSPRWALANPPQDLSFDLNNFARI